jgi:formylglycine-generating enzyme required for sulfatase activity
VTYPRPRLLPRLGPWAALAVALAACDAREGGDAPAAQAAAAAPAICVCDSAMPAEPSATPEAESKRVGLPASFENELGMRFVLVPAGVLDVGSPADEPGRRADETVHEIRIAGPWYVATRSVTRRQWAAVSGPGGDGAAAADGAEADRPVVGKSHAQATELAKALTARDAHWVYRLPTEAEWEQMARAGGASGAIPEKGANAWGVEGLADGVGEWCLDRYAEYPDWAITAPQGPDVGTVRVVRGLRDPDGRTRTAARAHEEEDVARDDVGIRLMARSSYGKSGYGACELALRSVELDDAEQVVGERPGYEVRIIAVFDRLHSRQHNVRPLPWVTVPGARTPTTLHVPPGRYYVQCQVPGASTPTRGLEMKIEATPGTLHVDLPVPRPGATLNDPE